MTYTRWRNNEYITTWEQFNSVIRTPACKLLKRLDEFPCSILVTGCQRSGTTMLARIITQSDGMVNYWFGSDDELDAALILSGYVDHEPHGRYCFQTTYLNECYREYYEQANGHKILWVIRNPFSVVYSMVYGWRVYGINQVFKTCGVPLLRGADKWLYRFFGLRGVNKLRRACWAYIGKTEQILKITQHLDSTNVMVLDYDDLVNQKELILPRIYEFIKLTYSKNYAERIHSKSLNKSSNLSRREFSTINQLCEPIYRKARLLLS